MQADRSIYIKEGISCPLFCLLLGNTPLNIEQVRALRKLVEQRGERVYFSHQSSLTSHSSEREEGNFRVQILAYFLLDFFFTFLTY